MRNKSDGADYSVDAPTTHYPARGVNSQNQCTWSYRRTPALSRWKPLTPWLQRCPQAMVAACGSVAAFTLYYVMNHIFINSYAAIPFAELGYENIYWAGTWLPLDKALALFELMGYLISKIVAVKVVPESINHRPWLSLVLIICCSELSLILLGVLPNDAKVVASFLNGLPTGLVWGFVVAYLEGRRATEVMLVSLSLSYMLSAGPIELIGSALNGSGVDMFWVPAALGALLAPIYLLCVWLLHQLPPPSDEDVAERLERTSMNRSRRWAFLRSWGTGLVALLIAHMTIMMYKEYREYLQPMIESHALDFDLRNSMPYLDLWIGLSALLPIGALVFVRSNAAATFATFCWMFAGSAILLVACILITAGRDLVDNTVYYVLTGLGCMMGYAGFTSSLFERLLPYTGELGTITLPMAVADVISYTAVVGVFIAQISLLAPGTNSPTGYSTMDAFTKNCLIILQTLGYLAAFSTVIMYAAAIFYFFIMYPKFKRVQASGQIAGVAGIGRQPRGGFGISGGGVSTPTIAGRATSSPDSGSGNAKRGSVQHNPDSWTQDIPPARLAAVGSAHPDGAIAYIP